MSITLRFLERNHVGSVGLFRSGEELNLAFVIFRITISPVGRL